MTITDPLVLAYLEHLRAENVSPPNTIASRKRTLGQLSNPGTATRAEVEAWWKTRADLSPATRVADRANLRTFYQWCVDYEHRDDDPTHRLKTPRVANRLPNAMKKHDLLTLLDVLPPDLRRAVILGAYGGLRVSEAAALDWDDVDTEARTMRIIDSKGAKSRPVMVGFTLLDEIAPNTGGNVVTAGGKAYSAAVLQRKVNRAMRAAGVQSTFHQLRHRYGEKGYQASRDILALGRQMGHSSPTTTAIYAAPSDDMARLIADAVTQ